MTRILAIVAFVLGLGGIAGAQGVSPGPLAKDHAALEGVDNCIRCHTGGDAISAQSCLSCHKALGQRIAAKQGYHVTVGNDCASCHPDHRGTGAALVRWPGGVTSFDHTKAGYALSGGHAKVACRDCHKVDYLKGTVAGALSADERPRTYLGLATSCATCHKDVHSPSLGSDCAKCHSTAGWKEAGKAGGSFDHGKTKFPLLGGHAKVACEKCHGGTAQKLAEMHPKFDTCKTCHQDPHAGAMGTAATACATCHRESAWKDLHYDRKTHAPRTVPLTGGHATPTCAACHGEKIDKKPATTCLTCHADPHKPSLGARCESCHQATSWTKAEVAKKTQFHDKTSYPLRGLHTTVPCDKCHDPKKPAAKRYRPVAHATCLNCHADIHQGQASKPCDSCHAVEGWKPPRFEATDHAKTRFALEGAHLAVPCAKCHPAAPKPPGFNQGNPACEKCHADPHKGQFAGKGTCATCHGVAAWSPSTFAKDAHAKAGFQLVGKHDVACGRCHAQQKFVGVSTECSACHEDRHAGQLAPRKCTECHAGAAWKPTPGFDHAKTFVLRGRHEKADCVRCHPKIKVQVTPAVAVDTEVYRLGPKSHECTGCHRPQHGDPKSGLDQPRKLAAATRTCESCHLETDWRDVRVGKAFDHNTTGAPLIGGHARAACSGCHNPGHGKVPQLVECTGCHQDRHFGRMGDRCEGCHSPMTWKQDQLLIDHQRTRLPLVGAHAVQGCPACHTNVAPGDYRGLDPACRSCHLHTVMDRQPHPDHTKDLAFNTCENCHSVLGWAPAHIDHDKFWPLTGKHQSTACSKCHKTGEPFSAAPKDCFACHMPDRDKANMTVVGHDTFGTNCGLCHNTTSWLGATFNHTAFPQSHHGATCAQCHPTPNMPTVFSCTTSPCHPKGSTDNRHGDVGGYMYDSNACLRCHAGGRGGN